MIPETFLKNGESWLTQELIEKERKAAIEQMAHYVFKDLI